MTRTRFGLLVASVLLAVGRVVFDEPGNHHITASSMQLTMTVEE
jgi:hypothetical protein